MDEKIKAFTLIISNLETLKLLYISDNTLDIKNYIYNMVNFECKYFITIKYEILKTLDNKVNYDPLVFIEDEIKFYSIKLKFLTNTQTFIMNVENIIIEIPTIYQDLKNNFFNIFENK